MNFEKHFSLHWCMKKWVWIVFVFVSLLPFAQTGSEIILFDLNIKNGHNSKSITNNKG
jgi:hypothetical protein